MIQEYSSKARSKIYLMSYDDNWRDFEDVVNTEFIGFAYQGQTIGL